MRQPQKAGVRQAGTGRAVLACLLLVAAVVLVIHGLRRARIPEGTYPASMPTYEILDRDVYDSPGKTQLILHAVVSGTVTEPGLRRLLQELYDEARATRAFKYRGGGPSHIAIFLYTSRDHFASSGGHWIAMLARLGEDSPVNTEVRTELVSQLYAKPEVKYGLSEPRRKEIFSALIAAERQAEAEAERMFPELDPFRLGYSQAAEAAATAQVIRQAEAAHALARHYWAEVARRYGVTEALLRDIVAEGLEANWPWPPR